MHKKSGMQILASKYKYIYANVALKNQINSWQKWSHQIIFYSHILSLNYSNLGTKVNKKTTQ